MKHLLAVLVGLMGPCAGMAQTGGVLWKITQPVWNEGHERQFGEFVTQLGMAVEKRQCGKVDTCLRLPSANPYVRNDPPGLKYYADCADLPYYLRSYFAWKNGLPFSMVSEVLPLNPEDAKNKKLDVRYSPSGNYVSKRYDVVAKDGFFKATYPQALEILNNVVPAVTFSASYRMSGEQDSELFTDFYPVKISRQSLRPGTVIYDPAGHVAIVYKVTDEGRIFYIDAHPDNSLTTGMYTPKFARSKPAHGAGFKNFRPLKLVDAKGSANDGYVGGRIVALTNAQLPAYGTEQFYGTQRDPGGSWNKGKFFLNNQQLNYFDYVQMTLMQGEQHIDPLKDIAQLTEDICTSLVDRVEAVEGARKAGIHTKPHPSRLPRNIYGTDGEWENYSTPSRDARLKVSFMDLLSQAKSYLERYQKRDPAIRYTGGNLAADLLNVYAEKAKACQFSYVTSQGKTMVLNLEAARQRLFQMSFDPYHCPELRWGARLESEMAGCADDSNKLAWYERERWLRYQYERRYEDRMDYSLEELTGPLPGAGIAAPPEVDIVEYLKRN
ncbi:MAG: hypothetical protein AAGB31_16535, partial [Bdellovibrio sp.]